MTTFTKNSKKQTALEKKFYLSWIAMRARCRGNNRYYKKNYLDRGIKVSKRWEKFEFFFIDMWESHRMHYLMYNGDTQLDRVDNDRGYCKNNCRWATRSENQSNKRNTKLFYGKTLAQWSRILKINRRTLAKRIYSLGWSVEKALQVNL